MTGPSTRIPTSARVACTLCAALLCLSTLTAAGCASRSPETGGQGTAPSSPGTATAPGSVSAAEATALFSKVGTAMSSSDIPPAEVDVYATVLSALEARQAAAKESKPATGPSEAAIGSAVSLWKQQFKFADNAAVARAVDDVTAKLTGSSDLTDAEAIVWVTARDVTEALTELGGASAVEPEADGWVKVVVPSAQADGATRTVRVRLAKDGAALRVVGMDFGGAFAGSKAPPATN